MITIADEIRAEARDEVLEEGRVETSRKIAMNLLADSVDFSIIERCTGLSLDEIQKLSESKNS